MNSLKGLVEYKNDKLYFKGSDEPIELFEDAVFSMEIDTQYFKKQPKIVETKHILNEGTKMYFKIPGVGYFVSFKLIDPLVFIFRTGAETKIETDVRCEVYAVNDVFFPSSVKFEPFITDTLHQVYDNISRLYKPKAKNHHAHIFNHFRVESSNLLLNDYRKSIELFKK